MSISLKNHEDRIDALENRTSKGSQILYNWAINKRQLSSTDVNVTSESSTQCIMIVKIACYAIVSISCLGHTQNAYIYVNGTQMCIAEAWGDDCVSVTSAVKLNANDVLKLQTGSVSNGSRTTFMVVSI